MNKQNIFIGVGFFATIVASVTFLLLASTGKAQEGVPQTKDALQIQEVIKKSYELEALAGKTFDTSFFQDVFINDPRGGNLSNSTIEFITDVTKESKKPNYGYLDYKLTYYAWWKDGAKKIEGLMDYAKKENRQALTKNEMKSLIDNKGRIAMGRLKGNYIPVSLIFFSMEIQDEIAMVIFDDGPRTNQMTLVRVDNKWFIAGNNILSVHP